MQSKEISLNLLQLLSIRAPQRVQTIEGGRGVGKSTIIGDRMKKIAEDMPRSSSIIVCESYKQAFTRTLPSTIHGLEMLGFYENIHYTIGKNKNFPKPYKAPQKWENTIHCYTGTVFNLISQEKKGDGKGLNVDSVIADEAALLDEQELNESAFASNRGSKVDAFKDSPYFRSVLLTSSTPLTAKGRWMFKMEELAKEKPKEYIYLIANSFINRQNLPKGWFEDMKNMLLPLVYDAEICGKRITTTINGFYPRLNEEHHGYSSSDFNYLYGLGLKFDLSKVNCLTDGDIDARKELIIGIDWGSSINALTVIQKQANIIRFLKSMYVLSPKILDDLAQDFCDYYAPHLRKRVIMYYDRTGDNKLDNSRFTKAQQFANILKKNGWDVELMSHGEREAPHDKKFDLWNMLLSEKNPNAPVLRFNKENCKYLLLSMQNAEAIETAKGKIAKDKSPEKNKKRDQRETTHLSDSADVPIWRMFRGLLDATQSSFMPDFMR